MKPVTNIHGRIILLAGLLCFVQCSPRAGKRVLTFLFDGVPAADSSAAHVRDPGVIPVDSAGQQAVEIIPVQPEQFVHYPYQEKECAACHQAQSPGMLVEPQPGLCYTCHEDLGDRYHTLHGPVAGGYCTSCHDPHRSDGEKLLRFSGDQLCFYCHRSEDVYRNEMHMDLDGMACTDCHNPHGGEDRFLFQ